MDAVQPAPERGGGAARRRRAAPRPTASSERYRAGRSRCRRSTASRSTVKDSLLTADLPTTWGTPALRRSPHRRTTNWPVARARAAGALMVGKTNVPEFALEGYTANPLFGATRNPWNPALTPGGSSGGAVAAVAAGIAPLAIGQDGGGSIRRPASHTGLVGFKPSLGALAARAHAAAAAAGLRGHRPDGAHRGRCAAAVRGAARPVARPTAGRWPPHAARRQGASRPRCACSTSRRWAMRPWTRRSPSAAAARCSACSELGHRVDTTARCRWTWAS